jgi:hypothetical protein
VEAAPRRRAAADNGGWGGGVWRLREVGRFGCGGARRGGEPRRALYRRGKAVRGRYFRHGEGAHRRRRCTGRAVVAGRNPGRRVTGRLGQRPIKAAAVVGWQFVGSLPARGARRRGVAGRRGRVGAR